MEIDFDADNQDEIVRTVKKLSDLMRKRNIESSQANELLCGGKGYVHFIRGLYHQLLEKFFEKIRRGEK